MGEIIRNFDIKMECFLLDENFVWFIPNKLSILCKYNLNNKMVELLIKIPLREQGSFAAIIKCDNKLVLIPLSASSIVVFNISDKKFDILELPETNYSYRNNVKFIDGLHIGKNVFLIPFEFPYFLKLNMESMLIYQSLNWRELYERFIGEQWDSVLIASNEWDGKNTLFFGINRQNIDQHSCLGIFNLDTLSIQLKEIPFLKAWNRNMCLVEELIYICTSKGEIVIVDKNANYIDKITECGIIDQNSLDELYIAYSFMNKTKIIYVKAFEYIWEFDLKTKTLIKSKMINEPIVLAKRFSSKLIVQTINEGYFYLLDDKKIDKNLFTINVDTEIEFLRTLYNNECMLKENVFSNLNAYLDMMAFQLEKSKGSYQKCGQEIYKYITNVINEEL